MCGTVKAQIVTKVFHKNVLLKSLSLKIESAVTNNSMPINAGKPGITADQNALPLLFSSYAAFDLGSNEVNLAV